MHINILKFNHYKYFKIALFLLTLSIILYLTQGGPQPANGGTWQGYILGGFSALLIIVLTYLGIRKRSYKSNWGSQQGWTSSHVYLGGLLLCTATLHTGFQLGWNVHTLAYLLMLVVIVSGFYGIYSYIHFPRLLANNLANKTAQDRLDELKVVDASIASISHDSTTEIRSIAISAIEQTHLGGGFYSNIRGLDKSKASIDNKTVSNKNQKQVIEVIADRIPKSQKQSEAYALNELLNLFSRRQSLLKMLRRDLQIKTYLKFWLAIHIPTSVALIAALLVHIIVVFLYW
ncbi:MAG: hypothetical protein ACSHWU_07135 [Marinicella sp.]